MLETYGCGNFTSSRQDLVSEIKNAVQRGILIINCSQCYTGEVFMAYESGQVIKILCFEADPEWLLRTAGKFQKFHLSIKINLEGKKRLL